MRITKVLTGSEAAAIAAAHARPDIVPAYPITPQTGIIEKLSEMVATGELKNCQFVPVESEHSALASLIGAAQGGARVFTATSSHGLLYMHEPEHWIAGARLPVVMVNVNRAIGSPWNIACDRTDSMSQRDTGWIQLYCENNQEVYNTVLMAFRIAEATLIPVLVSMDGFYLSHTKEPVTLLSQEEVDAFLPRTAIPHVLDNDDPRSHGASGATDYYWRIKERMAQDLRMSQHAVLRVMEEFAKLSGRSYLPIEPYRTEDAEVALVLMGSSARVARNAVEQLRKSGVRAGMLTLRQFRPFPSQAMLQSALGSAKKVVVFDVNQYGILLDEMRNALYGSDIAVMGYTVGVGGVAVPSGVYEDAVAEALAHEGLWNGHSLWRGVSLSAPIEAAKSLPPVEAKKNEVRPLVTSGHRACAGCTATLVMRHVLEAFGKKTQIALPASCWSIIAGPNPYTPVGVPLVHCPFETAAATASGMKRAAEALGKDVTVVAFAGDGGTFDIGLQALSGAAERGEDIIYICYDNEAYMNTGGQRSSSTPQGAVTETTPKGAPKGEAKKNMMKIMAAHNIPYAATASIYHLDDLKRKLAKALEYEGGGLRFIQILAPCNTGWKVDPQLSVRAAHLAVETNAFPLVECDHGKWRITYRPERVRPLAEYVGGQGRFAHLGEEDLSRMKVAVDSYWEELEKLEKYFS